MSQASIGIRTPKAMELSTQHALVVVGAKQMRHDNYPDDIRRYDNDPRSPFFQDAPEAVCQNCDQGWDGSSNDPDGGDRRLRRKTMHLVERKPSSPVWQGQIDVRLGFYESWIQDQTDVGDRGEPVVDHPEICPACHPEEF